MKTIKKVDVTPVYVEDSIPEKDKMEFGKLYISKIYKTIVHLCLCGCNNEVITPLGEKWWTLIEENDKISMTPSIGSFNLNCKSHYIITKNKANFV